MSEGGLTRKIHYPCSAGCGPPGQYVLYFKDHRAESGHPPYNAFSLTFKENKLRKWVHFIQSRSKSWKKSSTKHLFFISLNFFIKSFMSVLQSQSMSINFFGTGVVVHRAKLQKLLCPTIDYPWEMKKEENKICLKWILKLLHSCGHRRTLARGAFLTRFPSWLKHYNPGIFP